MYQNIANKTMKNFHNLRLCFPRTLPPARLQPAFLYNQAAFQTIILTSCEKTRFLPCASLKRFQHHDSQKLCWKCHSSKFTENFCNNCNMIQPLDKKLNYFEVLGIKKSFKVDRKNLIMKYRQLQNIYHPDKYSVKSEKELALAEEHSSSVNKAYNVILHPVSRSEYMLAIAGHPIEEGEMMMDPDFLMDIMAMNERLADAENKDTVQEISRLNGALMEGLLREAEEAFAANAIATARGIVAKLKYYNNIYEKVKEYETRFGIVY